MIEESKCGKCGAQATIGLKVGDKQVWACEKCWQDLTLGAASRTKPLDAEIFEPELCDEITVRMAETVRAAHHAHLADATIKWVFIPRGPRGGGKVGLGKAKKQSPVGALVTEADFIIELSYDCWRTLNGHQRLALIDHELCHCQPKEHKDGNRIGWQIRKHDVEEFTEVVLRHGLIFRATAEYAQRTARQLFLAFPEAIEAAAEHTEPPETP